MKILTSYLKMAQSLYTEDEDDKYVSIGFGRFKEKGKEDDENAPSFTKDDTGRYVPSKKADSGGEKEPSKEPEGGEEKPKPTPIDLDADDFKRDFGGDTGTDADFRGEPPEGSREPDEDEPWRYGPFDVKKDKSGEDVFVEPDEEKDESIIINGQKYRPIGA